MLIYNATTKHLYAPNNRAALERAIKAHGWTSGEFAGASQWRGSGRKIRSGEQGVPIVILLAKTSTQGGRGKKARC